MSHRNYHTALAGLALLVTLVACSDDPPTKTDDNAPAVPSLVGPANQGSEVALDEALAWRCSDPNGDALTYALYFGETNPPPLLLDKLTDTTYVVKNLQPGVTYFWKVVASDPDGNSTGSGVMSFATTRSFQYPLAVGNRWGYDWTIVQDSVSGAVTPMMTISEASLAIEADTLLFDSIPAFILASTTGDGRPGQNSRLFSGNAPDGMYTYAYTNGSLIAPGKLPAGTSFAINGQRFGSSQELLAAFPVLGYGSARSVTELYVENPPAMVLAYPLAEGSHWTYRQSGNPWRIDRRVTGWGPIETPAGKFSAFEVEALYDIDNDGVWDSNIAAIDHVAPEGLVRREISIQNVQVSDEQGAVIGTVDFRETYVLRDYGGE